MLHILFFPHDTYFKLYFSAFPLRGAARHIPVTYPYPDLVLCSVHFPLLIIFYFKMIVINDVIVQKHWSNKRPFQV